QLVLVLEVVEEAGLGDAGLGDEFLDRRGAESLGEHRRLGDLEDSLTRRSPFAHWVVPLELQYLQYGFRASTPVATGRPKRQARTKPFCLLTDSPRHRT